NEQRRGQVQGQANNGQVRVADQGQQTPADAEMRMIRMTPDMERQVKLTPGLGQHVEQPQADQGDQPSRAGRGGGTFRGAIKVKHMQREGGGPRDTLRGQEGEGQAPVQILEDADEDAVAAYTQIFGSFNASAQQTLNDESIPISIRSYVQQYLQSISPDLFSSPDE
ncbi:MAG: hypothetical protein ACTSXZ_05280, partial [Alphaproteobacteria bacterium]